MCRDIPEDFPKYSKNYGCPVKYLGTFILKKFKKKEIKQIKQSLKKLCELGPMYNGLRTKRIIDVPKCPGYLEKKLPVMSIRAGFGIRIFWNLKEKILEIYGVEKRENLS